ncbi:MAG: DNA-binding protein [Bacteroidia bacterium]|nr:DNA-binding protein [Bacteroidia bacterium]
MNITFNELRDIKHKLPTGSIKKIAKELNLNEQTVRNYFGAKKFENEKIIGWHLQPGPDGGIVNIKDTKILDLARQIIKEHQSEEATLNED